MFDDKKFPEQEEFTISGVSRKPAAVAHYQEPQYQSEAAFQEMPPQNIQTVNSFVPRPAVHPSIANATQVVSSSQILSQLDNVPAEEAEKLLEVLKKKVEYIKYRNVMRSLVKEKNYVSDPLNQQLIMVLDQLPSGNFIIVTINYTDVESLLKQPTFYQDVKELSAVDLALYLKGVYTSIEQSFLEPISMLIGVISPEEEVATETIEENEEEVDYDNP